MLVEDSKIDLKEVEALVDAGQKQQLRLVLNDQHPADLAEALSELPPEKRLSCFRLLDLDNASAVLAEFDTSEQRILLNGLGEIGVVPIISHMSPDDAVDLLSELPEAEAKSIISRMTDLEAAEQIEELMHFPEDSAGGIMSTDYLAFQSDITVEQALTILRESVADLDEDIYDSYVVDEDNHLLGRLTLGALLTAPAEALLSSLIDDNVVKVKIDTDQEEAGETLKHYDLLSLPVVDDQGKLRGIITADDVFDVMEEEATEDIYQASGISVPEEEPGDTLTYNVSLAFRARLPWLLVTLIIESLSAVVITRFDQIVEKAVVAISFMPLLSAVTGSAATQSTCIIIRGTATGHIEWNDMWINLLHELKVGLLLGLACGLLTSIGCYVTHYATFNLGLIVGLSLFVTMTVGVVTGTLMPMIFHRLGIEPANASGPFITSLLDVCTFTIYLLIIRSFMSSIT